MWWETLYEWIMWGQITYMVLGLVLLLFFLLRAWKELR